MQVELLRSEFQRLLRQVPFRPFVITLNGGERAVIDHPENVAFDPRPGSSSDFYVLTGNLRLFNTFGAVSSLAMLSGHEAASSGEQVQA
ncbi:MAG TPA: hypothetical protein VEL76_30390 [Gemmataceae bacterium]|nr:hypothetical protein [Gemmataceae bacterium]